MARPLKARGKGRGFNSIAVRFGLMAGAVTILCLACFYLAVFNNNRLMALPSFVALSIALVLIPSAVTFLAAEKLAIGIRKLHAGTEAVLAGNAAHELPADSRCELGGLAESFQAMIGRLNANIMRMNVLAFTDSVTGLANRAVVNHVLSVLAAAESAGDRHWNGCTALLFLDLDGFKRVNDTLGHEVGDELLRLVAARVIEQGLGMTADDLHRCTTPNGELDVAVPEQPVFVRFAGDEFVLILPNIRQHALEQTARRVLTALSQPFAVGENALSISASIGIARAPEDTADPRQLLGYADLAMYAAKDGGKDQYRFFDDSLRQVAEDRNSIEVDLRKGIADGELSLQFQPKLNTRTLELVAVEALLRWEHPVHGMIPPDRFISIAEQSGLMPELGARVLDLAARQAREWIEQGQPLTIAVNLSPAQFERPQLVDEVLEALARHQVDAALLEIEISESMAMSDFAGTAQRMEQLRSAGVKLAIDDFGTGYSNLARLVHLPFDLLKIDRALVAEIGRNPRSEAIVAAVIHMAHALGHTVVAEGIEEQCQHDFLYQLGCDRVQGHLFAGAMTPAMLAQWRAAAPVNGGEAMQSQLRDRLSNA